MSIKVSIQGDITFSQEVTKEQAGKIITFLGTEEGLSGEAQTRTLGTITGPTTISPGAPVSLRELIDNANAKTNVEKIAVFASHLIHEKGTATFVADDIRPLFSKAGERVPKNYGRDLKEAVQAGYVQEAEQKGEYYLLNKATDAIAGGFTSSKSKHSRSSGSKKNSSDTSAAKVSKEIQELELVPDREGYPNYHELKIVWQKVLWLLSLAAEAKIDYLKPTDISYMASRLQDNIPANSLTSNARTPSKKSYLVKTGSGTYRLLNKGDEYLKGLVNEESDT